MAGNKDFIIQIKGLQIGKHLYDFPVGTSFFESYGNTQILGASLNADVELEKGSGWMNVSAHITGSVTVECDRCLDDLQIPMDFDCSMAVKFSSVVTEDDGDEFIIMDPSDAELDLSQFIYDYVCLNLPLQKVHEEGQCNKEMIARLGNMNTSDETAAQDVANSPFGALKDLFEKKTN